MKMESKLLEGIAGYLSAEESRKIAEYTVGIIGAGGLGSNAAMILARCGFRNFILCDMDKVEVSNLNRQYFLPEDIGKMKVRALSEKISELDKTITVKTHEICIDEINLRDYLYMADIIIEAVDDVSSKIAIFKGFNKYFAKTEKVLVTASGVSGYGNIARMKSRQLGANIYMVGDGKSDVADNRPLAPKVMMAAALEADAALTRVLGEKNIYRQRHMQNFFATPVYALTDSKSALGRSAAEVAEAMLKAGVKFLQYREKHKSMGEKYRETREIRALTRAYDATFIVNDHLDIALAVDADGVHMGQDDLPPHIVRELLGEDKILGISTHNPRQYEAVVKLNDEAKKQKRLPIVDYIGVGPVYATRTKEDVVDPVGLAYPKFAVARNEIPFVAIGGIKVHNLAEVLALGVKTAALVTEITGADDIGARIKTIADIKKLYVK